MPQTNLFAFCFEFRILVIRICLGFRCLNLEFFLFLRYSHNFFNRGDAVFGFNKAVLHQR